MRSWTSPESVHIAGRTGKQGPRSACIWCGFPIEPGQRYWRSVCRPPGGRQLAIEVEHANAFDCPFEKIEMEEALCLAEALAEVEVAIPVSCVVTSVLVAKVRVDGTTEWVSESRVEMRVGTGTDPGDPPLPPIGSDDEIPF